MSYVLANTAIAQYRRDGFLAIDRLISAVEIDRMRSILLSLHTRGIGFDTGQQFDAIGLDDGSEQRFPQIVNPRLLDARLKSSEYFTVGLAIAKQILGSTARLRNDITFLKPPKIGSDTPWHQDEAFANPLYEHDQLSIWLALTPATSANSCMSFVPGSHRYDVLEHQPVGGDPRIHALECVGSFDRDHVVECPLQAGGCTIHDHRTLHYAGPNSSEQHRLAYVLTFDTTPVKRVVPLEFPWRASQRLSARATREEKWRQEAGLISYAWQNRHKLSLRRGTSDLKIIARAALKMLKQGR